MAFEFNERFLLELNEQVYSCVYGQFIGNCDKDRKVFLNKIFLFKLFFLKDLRVTTKTLSLWAYMDSRKDDYINPFYNPVFYFKTFTFTFLDSRFVFTRR